jgi:hypothetical protein
MRDRIITALVTAIVHNKRMSIAGIVGVIGVLAAKFGLHLGADTLVWIASLIIIVIGAAGGDSHHRGARKILPLLLLCVVLTQTACPKAQTVRSVASATVAGCVEFKYAVGPDLTPEEQRAVYPVVDEVGLAADGVRVLAADWDRMSPAERRHLAAFAAEQLGDAAERLSAQGLVFKSERARRKVAAYQTWVRRAVSALRVIEATLPEPDAAPVK